MLARQRLLLRLLYPSLLEFPSSRRSAWEEAVCSAGDGVFLHGRLGRDPHICLSPTPPHQVFSRHVSRVLYRGGSFPRGSIYFCMGLGTAWADWSFRFVLIPHDPHRRCHRLGRRYCSEEKRNLASWPALEAQIWQGLVS